MTLSFPNSARSYDEAKQRFRFLGHDGMFEIRFFVTAEVLADGLSQRTASERDYLAAFDRMRTRILEAAKKAYSSSRKNIVVLDVPDFK